jgi:hypothetical protein
MSNKPKEKEQKREPGPKFVIPETFRIRRPAPSPMADILREAESGEPTLSQPVVSQPNPGRPAEPTPAGPVSQPTLSQPAASLLETAPDSAGFSKVPNRYFDHLCAHLSPDEQAVYSQLYRLSHGYGKETCLVSNARLSERSSVPVSTLKRVVVRLVGRGLVEKVNAVHGPQREQGVTYRVPAASQLMVSQPRTGQPATGHNKRTLKEKDSKSVVCDLCKGSSGMIYVDPTQPNLGVRPCTHGQGNS